MSEISANLLAKLKTIDTPTVCNALEIVAPHRRGYGFTTEPLLCTRPELEPIVGVARTATIRASRPGDLKPEIARTHSDNYYSYIDSGLKPSIVVIQDLDTENGYGSFWGEVNSNIHQGLGCVGVVTNGSVRDLPDVAEGFQIMADRVGPSHAFVHIVGFSQTVTVAGMEVSDGDLIHADQHGAVVIPHEVADGIVQAAQLIARREAVVIAAAQRPGFNADALRRAQAEAAEIH